MTQISSDVEVKLIPVCFCALLSLHQNERLFMFKQSLFCSDADRTLLSLWRYNEIFGISLDSALGN